MAKLRPLTKLTCTRELCQSFRSNGIEEEVNQKRFIVNLGSGQAIVDYEKTEDFYNLTHSFIPTELRGKGLGTVLAEKVFDHLVARGQKFKLTCEFLRSVYEKNEAKYKSYIVE